MILVQHQNINSPLYFIAAHQKTQKPDHAAPGNNLSHNWFNKAIFHNGAVKNYYSKFDGFRYLKDPIMVKYNENTYLNQNRDLELFCEDIVGEPSLPPLKAYEKNEDLLSYTLIQIFDLRFPVNYIILKKIRLSEEYDEDQTNTNLYIILIEHREIKMISDGHKINRFEIIWDRFIDFT